MRSSTAVLLRFVVLASLLLVACGGVTGDIDNIALLPSEPPIPARAPIKLTAGMKNLSGATAGQVRYAWSVQVGSQQANTLPETGPGLTYQLPDIEKGDVTFTVQAGVNGTPIAGAQTTRTVNVERVTISSFRVSDANGQEVGDSVPPGTRLRLEAALPDTPAARAMPIGVQFTGPGGQIPVDASRVAQVTVPADVSSVRLTARLLYDGATIDERQVELKVAPATPTPTPPPPPPSCTPTTSTRPKLNQASMAVTGRITEPAPSSDVEWRTLFKAQVNRPAGVEIWVFLFPHVADPNRLYPQSPDAVGGRTYPVLPDGTMNGFINVGAQGQAVGECFDIWIAAVDGPTHAFLAQYMIESARTGDYPGILHADLASRGIRELDSVTVRRK